MAGGIILDKFDGTSARRHTGFAALRHTVKAREEKERKSVYMLTKA